MASKKVHREKPYDLLDFFHVDQNAWPYEPEIDKLVMDLINPEDRDRVPGVAVAVRKNQQVVHLRCYGYANLETGARITPNTIFDLGSLSKQFTAIAILDLLNKKKVALNDPLSKFFKEFPRYADTITVQDLLHHTAGLSDYTKLHVASRQAEEDWYEKALAKPDNWYPRMLNKKRKEITNKDVVQWIASQKLLAKDPETEFEYSNSGYVVLAELVSRVGKKRFGQYLNEVLFSDMMMKDTYVFDEACRFSRSAREIVNHAKCYNRVDSHFVPVGYTRGSIIRDLLWSPVHIKKNKQVNYGAGWHLLKDKYEKEVTVNGRRVTRKYESRAEFHRGIWLGWRGYFARGSRWPVPKAGKNVDPNTVESLGIVVLSNAVFGHKQFTTCRITQGISQFYWGKWKKDNIMNNFNCG